MVHQIDADGVVPVHREGHLQFCADAIDANDQHWLAHPGKIRREQSAKAANFSEHFRTVCLPNESPDLLLQLVAQIDIYTGTRVSFLRHIERSRDISHYFKLRDPSTSFRCASLR